MDAAGKQTGRIHDHLDIRQVLSDNAIADFHAEVDADTIKRYMRGHRIVPDGRGGYEWVHFVDDNGNLLHLKEGEY